MELTETEQQAQISPRDHAMHYVCWNLICCSDTQKITVE